jgi:pyroglutamyl-peptidase
MKRAILTGFEPFGPYKYNPVQDTAIEYNRKILGDIEIIGLVLPCTYYGAFKLLSEKIDALSPDIIIGSGLASRIQRIRLEAFGRNVMNGKYPDNEGRKADNEPIIKDGNLLYQTNSNSILLASALYDLGISSEVSIDAEGFICNSLIYLTAKKISDENLPIKFAFFHTPWTEDYLDKVDLEPEKVTIKKNNLRRTIEILVRNIERNM